jgi:hypothetical protein
MEEQSVLTSIKETLLVLKLIFLCLLKRKKWYLMVFF